MKKSSMFLKLRAMKIKPTLRYHFCFSEWQKLKTLLTYSWQSYEETGTHNISGISIIWGTLPRKVKLAKTINTINIYILQVLTTFMSGRYSLQLGLYKYNMICIKMILFADYI